MEIGHGQFFFADPSHVTLIPNPKLANCQNTGKPQQVWDNHQFFFKPNKTLSEKKLNQLLHRYHDQKEKLLKHMMEERPIDLILELFKELGFRHASRTEILEFAKEAFIDIDKSQILYKTYTLEIAHTNFLKAIDKEQFLKYEIPAPLLQVLMDTLKIHIDYDRKIIHLLDKKIETIGALLKFKTD